MSHKHQQYVFIHYLVHLTFLILLNRKIFILEARNTNSYKLA